MIKGYSGKLLRIDLSKNLVQNEELDQSIIRQFLGGEGIASTILFKEVGPTTDPLSPDNRFIFMTGAFVGTTVPCGIKSTIVSKSPLTGIYGESVFSAPLGVDLKNAGYDGIVIQGRAKKPSYLLINDGKVEIKDARHLWGKETFAAVDAIRKELKDDKISIITIGPAGEKLVKLASALKI
jgi:aldehyde:ferredoxin oxidoreductase